ncbi:MAG: ferredoxin [Planctomycetota bacterium]|nr:MAG: ferredoxin [Planctomycetota bacterium]
MHILVCQNQRDADCGDVSCAGEVASSLRQELKDFVDEHKLKGKVRVTSTKCLGPCAKGPNVMIYPQEIFFSKCSAETIDEIKTYIIDSI